MIGALYCDDSSAMLICIAWAFRHLIVVSDISPLSYLNSIALYSSNTLRCNTMHPYISQNLLQPSIFQFHVMHGLPHILNPNLDLNLNIQICEQDRSRVFSASALAPRHQRPEDNPLRCQRQGEQHGCWQSGRMD